MYNLVIEPAKQPVDYNAAMRELYEHAHRRHLRVVLESKVDGVYHYTLRNTLDNGIVSYARIAEALEEVVHNA